MAFDFPLWAVSVLAVGVGAYDTLLGCGQNQTFPMLIQLPAVYRVFIDTNGPFEGFADLSGEEHYVILWGEESR